ncbi:MAG: class I SAM-dependent methyltransferase, partial [Pseudomonadota bacterium]
MKAIVNPIKNILYKALSTVTNKTHHPIPMGQIKTAVIEKNERFDGAPPLTARNLQNCQLLVNRQEILKLIPKGSIGVEVGVLFGDFSQKIIDIVQPQTFHLIDLEKDFLEAVKSRLLKNGYQGKLHCHCGNSNLVLKTLDQQSLDWIYVDGGHDYHTAWKDLVESHRLVK